MDWWFGVAHVLTAMGEPTPSAWQYRPGAAGNDDVRSLAEGDEWPDQWIAASVVIGQWTALDLTRAGNILHRWTRVLTRAGLDY